LTKNCTKEAQSVLAEEDTRVSLSEFQGQRNYLPQKGGTKDKVAQDGNYILYLFNFKVEE
jgi:hypothetical protein